MLQTNFTHPLCLEDDAAGVDGFVDEDAGQGGEVVGVLGGEVLASAALTAMALDFGMTSQVVSQALGDNGTLLDDVHALWHVLIDFMNQQGVMGAAQDDRVNLGTLAQ